MRRINGLLNSIVTRRFLIAGLSFSMLSAALSISAPAQAQSSAELGVPDALLRGSASNLDLLINNEAAFDLISPAGLSYDPTSGDVLLDVHGDLFCFDFEEQPTDPAVRLSVNNANDDPILEAFHLSDALEYRLLSNQIAMATPDTGFCFYRGADGFGLFGQTPQESSADNDIVFADRMQRLGKLRLTFENVPEFVVVGQVLNYRIVLENIGSADLDRVGMQELYPRNPTFFPLAQLTPGAYICSASGGANCADAAPGPQSSASIRGQFLSLPAGGRLQFDIALRTVWEDSQSGGTIHLLAGAVAADSSAGAPIFAANEQLITVVGEATQMVFQTQPGTTTAGQAISPPVVVRLLDADGNHSIFDNETVVRLNVLRNGNQVGFVPSQTAVNGDATFANIVIEEPGSGYTLEAISTALQNPIAVSAQFEVVGQ